MPRKSKIDADAVADRVVKDFTAVMRTRKVTKSKSDDSALIRAVNELTRAAQQEHDPVAKAQSASFAAILKLRQTEVAKEQARAATEIPSRSEVLRRMDRMQKQRNATSRGAPMPGSPLAKARADEESNEEAAGADYAWEPDAATSPDGYHELGVDVSGGPSSFHPNSAPLPQDARRFHTPSRGMNPDARSQLDRTERGDGAPSYASRQDFERECGVRKSEWDGFSPIEKARELERRRNAQKRGRK
jgi:hypothetical protein